MARGYGADARVVEDDRIVIQQKRRLQRIRVCAKCDADHGGQQQRVLDGFRSQNGSGSGFGSPVSTLRILAESLSRFSLVALHPLPCYIEPVSEAGRRRRSCRRSLALICTQEPAARPPALPGQLSPVGTRNPPLTCRDSGKYPTEACLNIPKLVKKWHFGVKPLTPDPWT